MELHFKSVTSKKIIVSNTQFRLQVSIWFNLLNYRQELGTYTLVLELK